MKSTILLLFIATATATMVQPSHPATIPTASSSDDDDDAFEKSLFELDNLVSEKDLQQALRTTRTTPPPSRATVLVRQFGIAFLLGCIAFKETLQEKFYRVKRYCAEQQKRLFSYDNNK